jgi:VanZ family protein
MVLGALAVAREAGVGLAIVLTGVAFAMAVGSLQPLVAGRTARINDVFNDLVGIFIGLALVATFNRVRQRNRGRQY